MIRLGTRTNGELRRRTIPVLDDSYFKAEWMESGADPELSPTVALIEQPPHSVLVPHFHRQNQFQLFVEGSGSIGPSALSPLSIHYAGAYTGYGPWLPGRRASNTSRCDRSVKPVWCRFQRRAKKCCAVPNAMHSAAQFILPATLICWH